MKRGKISNSLKKSFPLLKITAGMNKENRAKILKDLGGDKTVYNALYEIAHNTIKGNYKMPNAQSRKLKPFKPLLQQFCIGKNKSCAKKRRKLIEQSGGLLPILIPALATVLSSIISRV